MGSLFNGPDLHAPRKREKIKDFLAYPRKDQFGFFKRLKQNHLTLKQYSNRDLAKCMSLYLKEMAENVVIDSWNGVLLPENLGVIIACATKIPNHIARKNIDFKNSKIYRKLLKHINFHSDGYVAKLHYVNSFPYHRLNNHKIWQFKPCRELQRKVSKDFKNGNCNKYIKVKSAKMVFNHLRYRKLYPLY